MRRLLLGSLLLFAFPAGLSGTVGCAAKRPVLYPNDQLYAVGAEVAERDISDCMERASADVGRGRQGEVVKGAATEGTVGAATGAAGGAVVGRAGKGAAIGGAAGAARGFVRGLMRSSEPDSIYRAYVHRCLREFGYEPIGWR